MPTEPIEPGGSHDPTRAHDPVDPTRAQDPVDPTRVQPGVDPTRAQDATFTPPATSRPPLGTEPVRRSPDDDDRKGAAWLWALLAAVLIGIVLFALLRDNDDDDSVGTTDQTDTTALDTVPEDTAVEDTTAETAPEDTAVEDGGAADDTTGTSAPTTSAAPATDAAGAPGTVTTADGTDLFTLVQGDAGDAERLAPHVDQDVAGDGVFVLDVVDGEGFWIGADEQQRIFAHAPDDVAVEVGQRIAFDGFLKANPAEDSAEVHDIPEDQGAELHRQQGHHIELRSLTPA